MFPGVYMYMVIVMVMSLDNSMNNMCKAQYKVMNEVVQKANTMAGVL